MAFDVIPRHVWGAEPAWGGVDDIQTVEGTVVHWEGAEGSLVGADPAAQLRGIQAKCKASNYSDIFYSWAVSLDGRIWECRGWGRNSAANGTTDSNAHYYAVCVLMGQKDELPNEVKRSVGAILDTIGGKVYPHNHFYNTACPGDEIRVWLSLGFPHDVPFPTGTTEEFLMSLTPDQQKALYDNVVHLMDIINGKQGVGPNFLTDIHDKQGAQITAIAKDVAAIKQHLNI